MEAVKKVVAGKEVAMGVTVVAEAMTAAMAEVAMARRLRWLQRWRRR